MDTQPQRPESSVEGTEPQRSVPPLPITHLSLVEPSAIDLYASLAESQRSAEISPPPSRIEIAVAILGVILFVLFVFALNDGRVPL